jgi:hypothetical protein
VIELFTCITIVFRAGSRFGVVEPFSAAVRNAFVRGIDRTAGCIGRVDPFTSNNSQRTKIATNTGATTSPGKNDATRTSLRSRSRSPIPTNISPPTALISSTMRAVST